VCSSVRILVAAWGCPWSVYDERFPESSLRWSPVTYVFKSLEGTRYELRTVDTVPLLDSVFKFDKIIIVVQDTVLAEKVSNYYEVEKRVCEMYLSFIKAWNIADVSKVDLIVCPGVGNFVNRLPDRSVRLSISGEMYDFYAVLYVELAKKLCSVNDYNVEVHVDLTHGINYMPTLLYRAVKELLQLIAYTRNVKLYVYNSEPFICKDTPLNIHIVEETEPKPAVSPETFRIENGRVRIKPLRALDESIGRELSEKLNSVLRQVDKEAISLFIASIVNGLPLLLYSSIPDSSEIEDLLTKIHDIYRCYISIEGDTNNVKIIRKASYRKDIEILARALVLSKILKDVGISRKDEVTLKDIEKAESTIFKKQERYMHSISYDRYEIEQRVKEVLNKGLSLTEYVTLAEIFGTKCEGEDYFKTVRFVRNFLAHSGFEKCVTEIKIENNDIKLRYNSKFRKYIAKAALEGLRTIT